MTKKSPYERPRHAGRVALLYESTTRLIPPARHLGIHRGAYQAPKRINPILLSAGTGMPKGIVTYRVRGIRSGLSMLFGRLGGLFL